MGTIKYIFKDATVGLLCLTVCWGMLFQVFRLGYLCLGQVSFRVCIWCHSMHQVVLIL